MDYSYEEENFKKCPVCGHVIDYHYDGFYHDTVLNVWICRDHPYDVIIRTIKLEDQDTIEFILHGEVPLLCPRCAGKEFHEPEDDDMFEVRPCSKCGRLTAPEMGAAKASRGY